MLKEDLRYQHDSQVEISRKQVWSPREVGSGGIDLGIIPFLVEAEPLVDRIFKGRGRVTRRALSMIEGREPIKERLGAVRKVGRGGGGCQAETGQPCLRLQRGLVNEG